MFYYQHWRNGIKLNSRRDEETRIVHIQLCTCLEQSVEELGITPVDIALKGLKLDESKNLPGNNLEEHMKDIEDMKIGYQLPR